MERLRESSGATLDQRDPGANPDSGLYLRAMTSVVEMIRGVRAGDRTEFDRLFASLYDELHRLAGRHLRDRDPGQTLDTTALIH
jgi:hypothetical protein